MCKFFLGIILLIVVFIGCLSNMYISNEAGWIFLISLILIATGIDDALNNNSNTKRDNTDNNNNDNED